MKKIVIASLAASLFSTAAFADVAFNLSVDVSARCEISKASASNGQAPTVVVHSACNAETFRLRFANEPVPNPIDKAEGNDVSTLVSGNSVIVTPRRPGQQVTVIHLARNISASDMGSLSIELY